MSITYSSLTADSAPSTIRPLLAASQAKMGFLASPVARAAHAPVVLKHLLAGFGAFDQTTLSPLEREVVAMTVAYEHACHYCMAMHTALQAGHPDAQPIVAALRTGAPLPDGKLDALRSYARALVLGRGHVDEMTSTRFADAGYTAEQALEVVLGVAQYTLSTFLNIVTDAPLDAPFEAFRW